MSPALDNTFLLCEVCDANDDEVPAEVKCICDGDFCPKHWIKHLKKHPRHKKAPSAAIKKAWHWIKGTVEHLHGDTARSIQFEKDECSKWFGLVVESSGRDKITSIVETARFSNLIENSVFFTKESPKRQYPSLVSFVGECGAGKSTLIRALISINAGSPRALQDIDAPIPGAQSGTAALAATTGEVNLYPDPTSFGTKTPRFYADCEGLFGAEPCAAQYQKTWHHHGRHYVIHERKGEKMVDRTTAVQNIYPRFLYMFSDVVCLVTRNPKRWTDEAVKLLQWASIGAHNTVNQYALPAAVIILNGPQIEDEAWVSEDLDFLTKQFFDLVGQEIDTNEDLRQMAKAHGVSTLKDLFARNFSNVYVHFVPHDHSKILGSPDIILQQHERLLLRLKNDVARMQIDRENSWQKYDSKQMSILFHYVFKHLADRKDEPFDFSACRRQACIPETVEGHLSEFLERSLAQSLETNFSYAAKVLASYFLRNAFKQEGMELVLLPEVIFNNDIRNLCRRSIEDFLETGLACSFVDPDTGKHCVNTKKGHSKGHQSRDGRLLAPGLFVSGPFDSACFERAVKDEITAFLVELRTSDGDDKERQNFAKQRHLQVLRSAGDLSFWQRIPGMTWGSGRNLDSFSTLLRFLLSMGHSSISNTCFGCLFGRIEYRLPCGHLLCFNCIRDFNQSRERENYPATVVLENCVLCGEGGSKNEWPFKVKNKPEMCGLRVLSLDGGGVRGIVEIIVLKRIEDAIGLSLPIGEFFDFISGTSAGGMIAMGIGVHGWNADTCIQKFREFSSNGLQKKTLTKAWGIIGLFARWAWGSIYQTDALERALQRAYPNEELFGLRRAGGSTLQNTPKIAVTTTVEAETRLFSNYNCGGAKHYLKSNSPTWEVARSTSAAPMYFEAYHHSIAGVDCRDGGLRDNNPVAIAIDESHTLWGDDTPFDVVLSVGSGTAMNSPSRPMTGNMLPGWLDALFNTFLQTMNGQDAWERYLKSADTKLKSRSRRLNVGFKGVQEPDLDSVDEIDSMAEQARNHFFYLPEQRDVHTSIIPSVSDAIEEIALRLRASLFFFEPSGLTYNAQKSIAAVKGHIYSRIEHETDALRKLIAMTECFLIRGVPLDMPAIDANAPFKLPLSFQQEVSAMEEPIRIDAKFHTRGHRVPISGCPLSLKSIKQVLKSS